ncbi:hypothetical protein HY212_03855 [Candidatus Pacearchaeota archaeon]|nr:hypothetical protein [Candidatus Pacearchaeota archaeon]
MIIQANNVLHRASAFKATKLSSIQDRVLQYSKLDRVVGETEITTCEPDSTHPSTVKVYIAKSERKPNTYFFIDGFGEKLGCIELWICKMIVNDETYYPLSKRKKFPGAMHVAWIKSFSSGTGNAMHEFAVVLSNKLGYKGRVILEAARSSHLFHYLFGFRSISQKDNEDIKQALQLAEQRVQDAAKRGEKKSKKDYDSTYLGIIHMHLPEDAIPEILNRAQVDLYDEIIQEFSSAKVKS